MKSLRVTATLAVVLAGSLAVASSTAASPGSEPLTCPVGPVPVSIAGDEPLPMGGGACPGVRPGGIGGVNGACTLNFVFKGSDSRYYIGSAGHCTLLEPGERSWKPGTGPIAVTADPLDLGVEKQVGIPPVGYGAASVIMGVHRFGEAAYAILDDDGQGYPQGDFALIRIDSGIPFSKSVCYWGGPTGTYTPTAPQSSLAEIRDPLVLRMYGHGLGFAGVAPARTWISQVPFDENLAYAWGPGNLGDSGSPVMLADGRALGVTVAMSVSAQVAQGLWNGEMQIRRIGPAVRRAQQVLGITLTLQTAPLS